MSDETRPRAAVVTVSDGVSQGVRDDASGRAVARLLEESGFPVGRREVVPDERDAIESLLRSLSHDGVALVVTTGGTGFGPRDVTPEATRAVVERDAPGLAEEMRAAGRGTTPFAALSRGVAGVRGTTLIVNLPGSEKGATESLRAILAALPHALELLSGHTVHGPSDASGHAKNAKHSHGTKDDTPRGDPSIEGELARRRAAGESVVVATAIRVEGDPPCRVGQKMLLGANGPLAGTLGCAEFDDSAVTDAPGVLEGGSPTTRTYRHDLGTVEVFLEPHAPRPRLVLISATPVSLALMRMASIVGFEPVLVESRHERVTAEHRAAGTVVASVAEVAVDDGTSVVATDHDAPDVVPAIDAVLGSPASFVGVMGSRRHVGPHIATLRELGHSDEDLARIHTPVGLDVGARTAEEIALSMLAGVVAARRDRAGGWLDRS
jgi:molybdenum cofactor synthesis domain-containing protein